MLGLELLHAAPGVGEIPARPERLDHRKRGLGAPVLIDIAAAVEICLGNDIGLARFLARLGVDEHDFHARLRALRARRRGEFEMDREHQCMQNDGCADRRRKHAIVGGHPAKIHVHSYFNVTSP